MLKYRLMTALLLLPILLAIIFFFPTPLFALFMTIIVILMMREWLHLMNVRSPKYNTLGCLVAAAATLLAYYLPLFPLMSIVSLFWLWTCWAVKRYLSNHTMSGLQHRSVHLLLGLIMFMGYWKAAVWLQQVSPRPWWLLYGILMVWANDCGAYTFGRLWGKDTKLLAPTISPGKTWIGLWGGLIFGLIVTGIFSIFMPLTGEQRFILILISVPIILISVIGDLFESMLKRHAGVKDSGELLPGHGGMLDRLDSTLAALPVLSLALLLVIGHSV